MYTHMHTAYTVHMHTDTQSHAQCAHTHTQQLPLDDAVLSQSIRTGKIGPLMVLWTTWGYKNKYAHSDVYRMWIKPTDDYTDTGMPAGEQP